MNRALVYLDSSALIKLVIHDAETDALREFLTAWPDRVSSSVARVEVMRAARRVRQPDTIARARALLARLPQVLLDEAVLAAAGEVAPPELRALDAIHLATARSLGPDLAGMVVYDGRLAEAARRARIPVWAPTLA